MRIFSLNSLFEKFKSFGCETYSIDGHSLKEIDEVFQLKIKINLRQL